MHAINKADKSRKGPCRKWWEIAEMAVDGQKLASVQNFSPQRSIKMRGKAPRAGGAAHVRCGPRAKSKATSLDTLSRSPRKVLGQRTPGRSAAKRGPRIRSQSRASKYNRRKPES